MCGRRFKPANNITLHIIGSNSEVSASELLENVYSSSRWVNVFRIVCKGLHDTGAFDWSSGIWWDMASPVSVILLFIHISSCLYYHINKDAQLLSCLSVLVSLEILDLRWRIRIINILQIVIILSHFRMNWNSDMEC